jgi:hypothetical protein
MSLHCTCDLTRTQNAGGVGDLAYPLVSDLKKEISEAYGVLTDDGVALRGLFIIDPEGVVQHATINNLAFGRNVEETIRILAVSVKGCSWRLVCFYQLCLCVMSRNCYSRCDASKANKSAIQAHQHCLCVTVQ